MSIVGQLFGRKRRGDLSVVVYTRQGCHLCDDLWAAISKLQAEYHFKLLAVDVDTDPALVAKFDTCVPVVEVNGKVRLRGRWNAVLFQRILQGRSSDAEV